MTGSMLNLVVVSAAVLLILVLLILHLRPPLGDEKWLPRELRNAELVYAEKLFRSPGDIPMVAKCDRGYRTKKGDIVLVELKTRTQNRVFPSDVIELSAQRFAIHSQTMENVSFCGYILVLHPGKIGGTLHKVKLMSSADVVGLAMRRQDILLGAAMPRLSCSKGLCKKCPYLHECRVRS
jgi:CRISPR-associated exonuclease Cas4